MTLRSIFLALAGTITTCGYAQDIVPATPSPSQLQQPFGPWDAQQFRQPDKVFYPETWFHFINGNVDRDGITRDLEAISQAGITGISFFHGAQGANVDWPGTKEHIECLSPQWESLLTHTASEAHRLGLRFSIQTCPGWAMSGGPWIQPEQAMRHLTHTRTDVTGGRTLELQLPIKDNQPNQDYRDVAVIAFPTPDGSPEPLKVSSVKASTEPELFQRLLNATDEKAFTLAPTTTEHPYTIELTLSQPQNVRTLEFNAIDLFNHEFGPDPGIHVRMVAMTNNGEEPILDSPMPRSNWQDNSSTMSFALKEVPASRYRIEITCRHHMTLHRLRLYTAARKNNWETEASWTLRSLLPGADSPSQDHKAYVTSSDILDLTPLMKPDGTLTWPAPEGRWTVLRIGHVNTGQRNGPAPAEATGWEVNKLDSTLVDYQFQSYVGRLAKGPLHGLLDNMLMDSWECRSQTWTTGMDRLFAEHAGYALLQWMPALFGYVIDTPETTAEFLCDWRSNINRLFVSNFYGRMTRNAHQMGMTASYETAAGDIFPGDPLEYYKWADVPMCEFWQPFSNFLADHNYKPIRPTASAAHMYGKPRVSAESFTSFDLNWNEHLSMLREVANQNMVEGVTHCIFHTYTHNPDAEHYTPGTSFGSAIGTPFLRQQTWWPYMPAFTRYLARCCYMLERGKPVSNVLWYIGDQVQHKPDQTEVIPGDYTFDYCNHDALLSRIDVRDGKWVTPEGICYDVLWLPETLERLLPETLEHLLTLVQKGGILVGNEPSHPATLSDAKGQQQRFQTAVQSLWHGSTGKGRVISGMSIDKALSDILAIAPDCTTPEVRTLHRQADGAHWYMICPQIHEAFQGDVTLRGTGAAELWNPVTGESAIIPSTPAAQDGYSTVPLTLQKGECVFVLFREDQKAARALPLQTSTVMATHPVGPWTLTFPQGWGIDAPLTVSDLQPWKDLPLSPEGKAFSGKATYTTTIDLPRAGKRQHYTLDLGMVEEIAVVSVNGVVADTLWTIPYQTDITHLLRKGKNTLTVDVISTWRNRLIYDASLPEQERKTWVIAGPSAGSPLVESGLLGPVEIRLTK